MAAFYWSNGPASGAAIIMQLTIVGEVLAIHVTSAMGDTVTFPGFQPCLDTSQTLSSAPLPLSFLPLSVSGTTCPTATSPSMPIGPALSPSPSGPGGDPRPYCTEFLAGATMVSRPPGQSPTPTQACNTAQNSPQLRSARSDFFAACSALRLDQAEVTAWTGAAAVAATLSGALIGAAIAAAGLTFIGTAIASLLAFLAAVAAALAIFFTGLAFDASARVGTDLARLGADQTAWANALAAVRRACCPDWIVIQTNDLVCPG